MIRQIMQDIETGAKIYDVLIEDGFNFIPSYQFRLDFWEEIKIVTHNLKKYELVKIFVKKRKIKIMDQFDELINIEKSFKTFNFTQQLNCVKILMGQMKLK